MGGPNPHTPEGFFEDLKWRLSLVERRLHSNKFAGFLIGEIRILGQTVTGGVPEGWVLADGTSYLRAEYPELFAVYGTTHGAADATHFNVPNMNGRVPVGRNPSDAQFDSTGETGGAKTHTLTESEMPSHTHATPTTNGIAGAGHEVAPNAVSTGYDYTPVTPTASTGGGAAHNNLQPYLVVNYIVFAGQWVNPDPGTYPGITYPSGPNAYPGYAT